MEVGRARATGHVEDDREEIMGRRERARAYDVAPQKREKNGYETMKTGNKW